MPSVDYPEHLLAREAPPSHAGEGPFALWHFSEDSSLSKFQPHVPATNPAAPPLVWAVDTRHAPMFWFPRDCPRGCIWPVSATTAADSELFFGQSAVRRIHVIESAWLDSMTACRLYAYRHARAGIELRITPSIWPFWRRVTQSTVEFSGSRLSNTAAHPEKVG